MIELIVSACLLADPALCKEVRIGAWPSEEMTVMQCSIWSLPARAEWMAAHPGWTITRWYCADTPVKEA